MPHLADGSPCHAVPYSEGHPLIAVGWLSGQTEFPQGTVPENLFRKLCAHAAKAWQPPYAVAGFHDCEVCQFGRCTTSYEGKDFSSRSKSELFIPTGSCIFVTPINIIHSISVHRYLPPADFLAAVEACPPQRSVPFLKLLLASGGADWLRAMDQGGSDNPTTESSHKSDDELLEDLEDLADIAERRGDPRISFEQMTRELIADGLLPGP